MYHRIENGKVLCAAPQAAPCRLVCRGGCCETWNSDGCACGPLVDYGKCNQAEFIEASGVAGSGPEGTTDQEVRDFNGPVRIWWERGIEGYLWEPVGADDLVALSVLGLTHHQGGCGGDWKIVDGVARCCRCGLRHKVAWSLARMTA